MAESVEPDTDYLEEIAETPVAMQDTDLRSMKDALLIETSQMLGVCVAPNSTHPPSLRAGLLLAHHSPPQASLWGPS